MLAYFVAVRRINVVSALKQHPVISIRQNCLNGRDSKHVLDLITL